jgi:ankyrin repeat protein
LLNFKARRFISAALHAAIRRSHPLAVEFLLRLGADCTTRNSDGDTALLAAIRKTDQQHLLEIARLLLTRSSPTDYDRDGNTALHLAVQLVDRYDLFEEILRHGTCFDKMNFSGETALHLAAKCGNQKAIERLLQYIVDMHERVGDSEDLKSALELAEGDAGPPLPPMNWGNSLRAICSIPFMLLRDVLDF